jgi:hypothetical protein
LRFHCLGFVAFNEAIIWLFIVGGGRPDELTIVDDGFACKVFSEFGLNNIELKKLLRSGSALDLFIKHGSSGVNIFFYFISCLSSFEIMSGKSAGSDYTIFIARPIKLVPSNGFCKFRKKYYLKSA